MEVCIKCNNPIKDGLWVGNMWGWWITTGKLCLPCYKRCRRNSKIRFAIIAVVMLSVFIVFAVLMSNGTILKK